MCDIQDVMSSWADNFTMMLESYADRVLRSKYYDCTEDYELDNMTTMEDNVFVNYNLLVDDEYEEEYADYDAGKVINWKWGGTCCLGHRALQVEGTVFDDAINECGQEHCEEEHNNITDEDREPATWNKSEKVAATRFLFGNNEECHYYGDVNNNTTFTSGSILREDEVAYAKSAFETVVGQDIWDTDLADKQPEEEVIEEDGEAKGEMSPVDEYLMYTTVMLAFLKQEYDIGGGIGSFMMAGPKYARDICRGRMTYIVPILEIMLVSANDSVKTSALMALIVICQTRHWRLLRAPLLATTVMPFLRHKWVRPLLKHKWSTSVPRMAAVLLHGLGSLSEEASSAVVSQGYPEVICELIGYAACLPYPPLRTTKCRLLVEAGHMTRGLFSHSVRFQPHTVQTFLPMLILLKQGCMQTRLCVLVALQKLADDEQTVDETFSSPAVLQYMVEESGRPAGLKYTHRGCVQSIMVSAWNNSSVSTQRVLLRIVMADVVSVMIRRITLMSCGCGDANLGTLLSLMRHARADNRQALSKLYIHLALTPLLVTHAATPDNRNSHTQPGLFTFNDITMTVKPGDTPSRSTTLKTTGENTHSDNYTPSRSTTLKTTSKNTSGDTPSRSTTLKTTSKNTSGDNPSRSTTLKTTGENTHSDNYTPSRSTTLKTTSKNTSGDNPSRSTTLKTTGENTHSDNYTPSRSTTLKTTSKNTSGDTPSRSTTLKTTGENTHSDNFLTDYTRDCNLVEFVSRTSETQCQVSDNDIPNVCESSGIGRNDAEVGDNDISNDCESSGIGRNDAEVSDNDISNVCESSGIGRNNAQNDTSTESSGIASYVPLNTTEYTDIRRNHALQDNSTDTPCISHKDPQDEISPKSADITCNDLASATKKSGIHFNDTQEDRNTESFNISSYIDTENSNISGSNTTQTSNITRNDMQDESCIGTHDSQDDSATENLGLTGNTTRDDRTRSSSTSPTSDTTGDRTRSSSTSPTSGYDTFGDSSSSCCSPPSLSCPPSSSSRSRPTSRRQKFSRILLFEMLQVSAPSEQLVLLEESAILLCIIFPQLSPKHQDIVVSVVQSLRSDPFHCYEVDYILEDLPIDLVDILQ